MNKMTSFFAVAFLACAVNGAHADDKPTPEFERAMNSASDRAREASNKSTPAEKSTRGVEIAEKTRLNVERNTSTPERGQKTETSTTVTVTKEIP